MGENCKYPKNILRTIVRGVMVACKTKLRIFVLVFSIMFALYFFLPPLMLSLLRQPADAALFNPWIMKLPAWLMSGDATLSRKLSFLYDFALFWFVASTHDDAGVSWFFVISVSDILRYLFLSGIFAVYFSVWSYRRSTAACNVSVKQGGRMGMSGGVLSALGAVGGSCTICGGPALPLIGFVIAGGDASLTAVNSFLWLSDVLVLALPLTLFVVVLYLGWQIGKQLPTQIRK